MEIDRELRDEVFELYSAGRKIDAIRRLRRAALVSLKCSKLYMEADCPDTFQVGVEECDYITVLDTKTALIKEMVVITLRLGEIGLLLKELDND